MNISSAYLYIFLTVALTSIGQLVLKYEVNKVSDFSSANNLFIFFLEFIITRPLVLFGFVCAFLASFFWMLAISKLELSQAYPFMSLNFVVVISLSVILFGENLNIYKITGLALIIVGVFIVSRGA